MELSCQSTAHSREWYFSLWVCTGVAWEVSENALGLQWGWQYPSDNPQNPSPASKATSDQGQGRPVWLTSDKPAGFRTRGALHRGFPNNNFPIRPRVIWKTGTFSTLLTPKDFKLRARVPKTLEDPKTRRPLLSCPPALYIGTQPAAGVPPQGQSTARRSLEPVLLCTRAGLPQ